MKILSGIKVKLANQESNITREDESVDLVELKDVHMQPVCWADIGSDRKAQKGLVLFHFKYKP